MNHDKNTNAKPTVASRLKLAMERLILRKAHPCDMPYDPQPQEPIANTPTGGQSDYSETEANINQLYGTSLKFGSQTTIEIDSNGRAKALTCKPSYIAGSGRRISDIDDVGGICRFCQALAVQAFNEGKLTAEQAQLQSLFDVNSARQCDLCGTYTCSIHCRPVQMQQGIFNLCVECNQELKRQEKRKRIFNLLLSPFSNNSQE